MSIYRKENIYAVPVAYYALNLEEFHMDMHCHDRCEIMYVVDGCCTVETRQGVVRLSSRQFIFLDTGVPHRLEVSASCTLLNYEFRCSTTPGGINLKELRAKSSAFQSFLCAGKQILVLDDQCKMGYALKDLIGELECQEGEAYLLDLLFQRMLIECSGCALKIGGITGAVYLKRAKEFIKEHLCESLNAGVISENSGIHVSYLQNLFSRNIGCGIMTYVNNLRIEQACFLLKNSSMKVTDIAFQVGFNSRQHFSYTFEKRFHIGPKQYRKLNSQNLSPNTGDSQQYLSEDGSQGERLSLNNTKL